VAFDAEYEMADARLTHLLGNKTAADKESDEAAARQTSPDSPQLWNRTFGLNDSFLEDMKRTGSLDTVMSGLLPVMEFKAVEFAGYLWRGPSVIYGRLNPLTGEMYVGQAETWERYLLRQGEHDLSLGLQHEFSILERPWPGARGIAVDVAEETWIRHAGGPLNQGGWLQNARYQMSEDGYRLLGGTELKPTPPLP
jgi:hypothetical protein